MRLSNQELRAAQSLHRWLRRTALAALPIFALSGCSGDDCTRAPISGQVNLPPDAGWAASSVHSSAECGRYCYPGDGYCFTNTWDNCVVSADAGFVTCTGIQTSCGPRPCGRLPAGLRESACEWQPSLVAAELAAAAHLEGAAVLAFETLERELLAHGAPPELVARARSAQSDEKRHHSSMSRLARRHGAEVPAVELDQVPVKSLLELAAENAVEGCVRETYGAAVAVYQGEWALDPVVRRAMRSIARDEAEHASLGWAVDDWVRSKLPRVQHARLDVEREQARAKLLIEAQRPVAPELAIVLGLPTPAASAALSAALDPLWT